MTQERIQLGLGVIQALCRALGEPYRNYPCALIAGTNGKGSTAAMLASIATAAGLRCGLFHSPSLGEEHEHLEIGGQALSKARYEDLRREVVATEIATVRPPTEFEVLTATAFLAFARERVDLAIIEAGLGGARDATNVCDPEVSVLVTVALDHQAFLGDSIDQIARDKAGIFRPGRPAVLGWLTDEAQETATRIARDVGSRLISASEEAQINSQVDGSVLFTHGARSYRLAPGLEGAHQARNAALATLAAEILGERFPAIDRTAIEDGVARCRLAGRLEWRRARGRHLLLDAAHNPHATKTLAAHLQALERKGGDRFDLLFGAYADKDSAGMLQALRPRVGRIWWTALDHERSWRRHQAPSGPWFESPSLAFGHALTESRGPILIAGSTSLIAAVRPLCEPLSEPGK